MPTPHRLVRLACASVLVLPLAACAANAGTSESFTAPVLRQVQPPGKTGVWASDADALTATTGRTFLHGRDGIAVSKPSASKSPVVRGNQYAAVWTRTAGPQVGKTCDDVAGWFSAAGQDLPALTGAAREQVPPPKYIERACMTAVTSAGPSARIFFTQQAGVLDGYRYTMTAQTGGSGDGATVTVAVIASQLL